MSVKTRAWTPASAESLAENRRYSAGAEPPRCAAAGLRRLRPPREPRRVFFFGFGCLAVGLAVGGARLG